jgi:N-methylhydantoinase A/oxoprolinase/acetone carboxylase beta subunit
MACFLGVDTRGAYTDAVILDEGADLLHGKAKSLNLTPARWRRRR